MSCQFSFSFLHTQEENSLNLVLRFDCSVHTNGKLSFHFWDFVGTLLLCCFSADKHARRQKKCIYEDCFIYEIFCQLCANILQSKGGEKGKCFCLISADMMTKNQCNSLGLALIGMSYESKKNAYLQRHLGTFFYKTQSACQGVKLT